MWGHVSKNGVFLDLGDFRFVTMHGHAPDQISQVLLTEDAVGNYFGWLPTGGLIPCMIYHPKVFEVCFAYGSQAEVERGRGVVIPLRIEVITNGCPHCIGTDRPAKQFIVNTDCSLCAGMGVLPLKGS